MTHPGIDVIRELLGQTSKAPTTLLERRANLAEMASSPPAPEGVTVEEVVLADRPAERLVPEGALDDRTILYLHGGGYCSGSPDTHRGLAGSLALAAGCTVVVLDYRLAPEDPFPAGLNDALLAFDQLRPGRVALAGDSAGGGLALAAAVALRERGGAAPVALALFSPWVDLTQTAASMSSLAEADPMLTDDALRQMADGYLAGTDARTPLASPLFADLADLPPMRIDVGSDEVLLDDSTSLAERAKAANVDVTLAVWPEMIHVFQAFPPDLVPEAAASIGATGDFLASHLSAAVQ